MSRTTFCLSLLFCLRLAAQQPSAESLTIADGLSQGMVYGIEQTRDGFLWFATKDGLNRYDGYNFKVFTNDPFNPFSIAGNDVGTLFEDSRGNLWLGIIGKGVDVLEKTSGKFLHFPLPGWEIESRKWGFEEAPDGTIILSMPNSSLKIRWNTPIRVTGDNADLQAYTTINPDPNPGKTSIGPPLLKDSKGRTYRITGDPTHTKIFVDPENEHGGGPDLIFEMAGSRSSSKIDRSDNLWLGTSGYGLRKIKLARQPFRHFLKGTTVGRILAPDAVYVSFGSDSRATSKLDEIADRATPMPFPLPNISQLLKAKNGDTYAIGDDNLHNYLLIVKGKKAKKLLIDPLYAQLFTDLVEDNSGNIIAGGSGGNIGNGLMRYEHTTEKIEFLKLPKQWREAATIFALHLDARQNLWFGTTNGIVRIALADLKFGENIVEVPEGICQFFQNDPAHPRSLRYNFVTHFCPDPLDPERYLWVSTKGGGLNLLDKTTGKFQHFTTQNSDLPNDVVYGILPDNAGKIWGSTNRGLFRLTISNGTTRSYRFRNFKTSDGLQADEFNTASFARAPDGHLFFGGVNGLTAFYPSEVEDRQTDAPVRITALKINNLPIDKFQENSPLERPLDQTEHLRLAPDQNLVTLEFALLDFANPSENHFQYRLKGVDPAWVDAGTNHVANYARLRPGDYLFEVQGSISGGDWSASATLRITVLPPWWATWWAYLSYALAICGGFWLFYKIRLRQKLEHQEARRLQELDDFKNRFFTNITHEFRTPLTVILGMTERLMADGGRQTDDGRKNTLNLIKRSGENLLRLVNQILDLTKLESNSLTINYVRGDILPYLRYIAESLHSLANAQNVLLRVESDQAKIDMDYDPERLLQIIHNLLSNAIKFTPSGGQVNLRVTIDDSRTPNRQSGIVIQVADTGAGIPPEDLPKIFDRFFQANNLAKAKAGGTGIGLALTKELVKAMGGEISVESEVGRGTTFSVQLPISRNAQNAEELKNRGFEDSTAQFSNSQILDSSVLQKNQILIIEDNPDVVEYLAACLREKYQLEFAYNGRAGIERALETVPDLVISDVMMPEKDGFEVCDFLKNDERTSHVPIVLLTAKADAASRLAGLRRGADAYLSKPFDAEELLVWLEKLLELRRLLRERYSQSSLPAPENLAEPSPENFALEDAFLQKVNGILEANMADENFGLPQLCQKVAMSRSQLFRKMKALLDVSPSDYIRTFRLRRAKWMLENSGANVAEAAFAAGFKDPSYFSKIFQEEFGVLPSATRK